MKKNEQIQDTQDNRDETSVVRVNISVKISAVCTIKRAK